MIFTLIFRRYLNGLLNGILPKQAQEVIFSQRIIKPNYPFIKLNNLPVQNPSSQNYLGMILDEKLNFESHLKETYLKFDKGVGAIKKNCEIFC